MISVTQKITKNQSKKLLKEWKMHLAHSRLSEKDINKRAREFTRKGMTPNGSNLK